MRAVFVTIFLLVPLLVYGDGPVIVPATQSDADAGVDATKYITPQTLSGYSLFSANNGMTVSQATNLVNNMLRAGTNTFYGSLPAATNSYGLTTNLPFVTVSAIGTNGNKAPVYNNGAMFGPDTPGTTTCGLQEAFNSMPIGTEYGPTATGIRMVLGPGYFYYTNQLIFSNYYTTSVRIEGSSLLETKLVYAGKLTNIDTIIFNGTNVNNVNGNFEWSPMHVVLRDCGFSAISNANNVLVHIVDHLAYCDVENCNFTGWDIMKTAKEGSGVSIIQGGSNLPYPTPKLVGLVVGHLVGEHATWVRNCFFADLATGAALYCDHPYVYGFKTSGIGINSTNGTWGPTWPNTSDYYLGAGLIIGSFLDADVHNMHAYACNVGIAFLDWQGANGPLNVDGYTQESVITASLVALNDYSPSFYLNNSISGNTTKMVNSNPLTFITAPSDLVAKTIHEDSKRILTASGQVKLASGAATVSTTAVVPTSKILLSYQSQDGTVATVYIRTNDIVSGTSFIVRSSNASDANIVNWSIVP